jgi:hypothetical protein
MAVMRIALAMLIVLSVIPGQIAARYVYFSPTGGCSVDGIGCMGGFLVFYVFIRAPDVQDARGARFFVEADEHSVFGNEHISSIETHENVEIEEGDLFSGITLSWPAGQYSDDTLLTVVIDPDNKPVLSMGVYTKSVQLYCSSGDTLQLDDFLFHCSHCATPTSAWIDWLHPDTVLVQIGSSGAVSIDCLGHTDGFGMTGTSFNAFDQEGWLDGCVGCSVTCLCGICPWDVTSILINVTVPDGVHPGTASLLRLLPAGPCCFEDSTSLYLYAVPDIGVETKSWGRLKRPLMND